MTTSSTGVQITRMTDEQRMWAEIAAAEENNYAVHGPEPGTEGTSYGGTDAD